MVTEIKPGIYWVGVVDWALKHFHGHELSTHRGSTYNAYLIVDEKVVLVDTVWQPFQDELLRNISQVIDPAKIDYVVANHAEVDHSGALPAVLRHAPNAAVVVSRKGLETIPGHYHQEWNFQAVKTGDVIKTGANELVFIEAPMLHWPDSMFTYVKGSNILMSNDAFGSHYASAGRFNDQVNQTELFEEALKYFVNILTPFSSMVSRKIDEVLALNLPVDMIAPSHGIIWRENPVQIVEKYREWAEQKPKDAAVIVYDTMWNGTRSMAEAVARGLNAEGIDYKIFHAGLTDRNDLLTEVFQAKAVIVGSPTFNQGVLPSVTPFLEELRGLKFRNKIGAVFGAYGWSGESLDILGQHLERCSIPLAAPGVKAKWQPGEEDLAKCEELGRQVAAAVKTPA